MDKITRFCKYFFLFLKKINFMNAHEIDYRIHGEEMQHVEIELDPNETAIAESGAFMMMDDGIQMETHIWRWESTNWRYHG
jgi:hypothetical protein